MSYLDYTLFFDVVIDAFKLAKGWDGLIKPWFNVLLPDNTVEQFVEAIVPDADPVGWLSVAWAWGLGDAGRSDPLGEG